MTFRDHLSKTRYGWTIIVFLFTTLLVSGLVIWQLISLRPRSWCALAADASPDTTNACLAVLLALINTKDHALIGLLTILGITVAGVIAVALGLKISGSGPGGTSVTIEDDDTTIDTGGTTVSIPTPPSEEKE